MMFHAQGHENITARHKNTIEFTKESNIGREADCIIGVNSDFDAEELKRAVRDKKRLRIIIKCRGIEEEINCIANNEFCDEKEIVIRIGEFRSKRTLCTRADKAAKDLGREMIEQLRNPDEKIEVELR